MRREIITFLMLMFTSAGTGVSAQIPAAASDSARTDPIREYFEWGEYDSLHAALNKWFSSPRDSVGSLRDCRYQSWFGVACFARGDIASAQLKFFNAVECDSSLVLDKKYVTPEMENVYSAMKKEIAARRARVQEEQALRAESAKREKQRFEALQKDRRLRKEFFRWLGGGFTAAGAGVVCAAVAGHEYSRGSSDEGKFLEAAREGDRREYDRYKSKLLSANRNIIIYSAASAASMGIGTVFFSRAARIQGTRTELRITGKRYDLRYSFEF